MTDTIVASLIVVVLGMAIAGCVYTLAAAFIARQYLRRPSPLASVDPGVTILKPLRGAEPGLHENLASFCAQDYAGAVQILFGVQDEADAAIPVVRRLIAEWPGRDLQLVIDAGGGGTNRKVANLINLSTRIRHEVVVLADSDIRVTPDYLSKLIARLSEPGVGAVTCLYQGVPAGGLWARLAAMAIDYQFLPSVLVGLKLGLARPCFGSTIALRRDTLAAIGGFEAFSEHLADDYAIGDAVRRAGMRVAIPAFVVEHACTERGFAALLAHELRWSRTIRAVDPWGFAGSALTYPVPLALVGAALNGFGAAGVYTLAAALACRIILQRQLDHGLRGGSGRWWLGPIRDALSLMVFALSFFVGVVSWRGQRYKVRPDGTVLPLKRGILSKES